jgi:hypothetical protein
MQLGLPLREGECVGLLDHGKDASPAAAAALGRDHLGLDLMSARIETESIEKGILDSAAMNHVLKHLSEPVSA